MCTGQNMFYVHWLNGNWRSSFLYMIIKQRRGYTCRNDYKNRFWQHRGPSSNWCRIIQPLGEEFCVLIHFRSDHQQNILYYLEGTNYTNSILWELDRAGKKGFVQSIVYGLKQGVELLLVKLPRPYVCFNFIFFYTAPYCQKYINVFVLSLVYRPVYLCTSIYTLSTSFSILWKSIVQNSGVCTWKQSSFSNTGNILINRNGWYSTAQCLVVILKKKRHISKKIFSVLLYAGWGQWCKMVQDVHVSIGGWKIDEWVDGII